MDREIVELGAEDAQRTPWKDGGGVTEQLAIWPAGASLSRLDFDWRISKSHVERDGAFSTFTGFDRILVVTQGAGLVLSHAGVASRSRLRALEPVRFDGGWSTQGELVAGPVADFNVFARRGAVEADVQVTRIGSRRAREQVGPDHVFVHALAGAVTTRVPREEAPFELGTGESLWVRGQDQHEEFEIAGLGPDAIVLLVRITTQAGGTRNSQYS